MPICVTLFLRRCADETVCRFDGGCCLASRLLPGRDGRRGGGPGDVPAGAMLAEFRNGPMAPVDEIVFALRQRGKDGHWYANFSYYSYDVPRKRCQPPFVRSTLRAVPAKGGWHLFRLAR